MALCVGFNVARVMHAFYEKGAQLVWGTLSNAYSVLSTIKMPTQGALAPLATLGFVV
jgi:hypothetical protein